MTSDHRHRSLLRNALCCLLSAVSEKEVRGCTIPSPRFNDFQFALRCILFYSDTGILSMGSQNINDGYINNNAFRVAHWLSATILSRPHPSYGRLLKFTAYKIVPTDMTRRAVKEGSTSRILILITIRTSAKPSYSPPRHSGNSCVNWPLRVWGGHFREDSPYPFVSTNSKPSAW